MDASVIIPSYNSRSTISQCLKAVLEQDTHFSYEVVVVDSSSDGTGELIESRFPEVRLIRLAERTLPGLARNLGIEVAQSKILAFTDSDCIPEPLWLDKMIHEHEKSPLAAIGGAVLNSRPFNPVAWSGYLLEFNERLPNIPQRFIDILPTCNVSFKRTVFERHGLFPTDLWPSEDHIYSWRLVHAGERLLFNPSIRVAHIFRPHLRSFMQHQLRLGKASAKARGQVDLPHSWAVRHPLRWLVPLVRLVLIESRLARWDLLNFLRFNLLLPLCFSGLMAWGIGFCSEGKTSHDGDIGG